MSDKESNNSFWFLIKPNKAIEKRYFSQREMAEAKLKALQLRWIQRERAGMYL